MASAAAAAASGRYLRDAQLQITDELLLKVHTKRSAVDARFNVNEYWE